MKRIHSLVVATALGLVCFHASAQEMQPQARGLCAVDEEPVFSCTLQGPGRKMVSLCASPVATQGERSFYYRYGKPSRIELTYPESGNGSDAFTSTHTVFAGATGGETYAFTNQGYKYILYLVSGTGFEYAGLQVQKEGQSRAVSDRRCRKSTSLQTTNEELWDATRKWKEDPSLTYFRSNH